MASCVFCRIASGEVAARLAYQDDTVVAFHDANPQAPSHLLIIPRKHIASVCDISDGDEPLVGHIVRIAAQLATEQGLAGRGFRLVANCGPEAGQSVDHMHFHLLGGRPMRWPPG
jgi:histidine triad (HIT) family protein